MRIKGLMRFPDGDVKIFKYCNTTDMVCSQFYNDIKHFKESKAQLNKSSFSYDKFCDHNSERVEFYLIDKSLYWVGSACRKCKTILTGLDPACNNEITKKSYSSDNFYSREVYFDNGDEGTAIKIKAPKWVTVSNIIK